MEIGRSQQALHRITDAICTLEVESFTDEHFALLEGLIDKAIQILSAFPIAEYRPFIERLLVAREGVEQGMSPNPAKRPSLEQMRQFVAAHLS